MKNKIITLIILIVLGTIIVGCTFNNEDAKSETETEKSKYIKYVQKLKTIDESTEDLPFDVNVEFNKESDEEVRFEVSIDNPKGTVKNIKALAIHDMQTDDVFPNVGIFDNTVTLVEGQKPEGVVLAGYIPYTGEISELECTVKVMIKYEYQNKKYTSYYVTKK